MQGHIIVLPGESEYRDDYAINDVLSYVYNSPYARDVCAANMLCPNQNIGLCIDMMQLNQKSYFYEKGKRLHHFILGISDNEMMEQEYKKLMQITVQYYANLKFQVLAVYHCRSQKNFFYPHIHVVVSHVSIDGKVFYGNRTSYGKLTEYLRQCTDYNWRFNFKYNEGFIQ